MGSLGFAACGGGDDYVTYYPITQCGAYPYPVYGAWLYSYVLPSFGGSSSGSSSGFSSGGGGRAGGGGSFSSGSSSSGSSKSYSGSSSSQSNIGGGPRGASKGGGGPGSNYRVNNGKVTYSPPIASRRPSVNDEIAATSARRNITLNAGIARPPYRTYIGGPGLYCYQVWYPIGQHPHPTTTTHPATTVVPSPTTSPITKAA